MFLTSVAFFFTQRILILSIVRHLMRRSPQAYSLYLVSYLITSVLLACISILLKYKFKLLTRHCLEWVYYLVAIHDGNFDLALKLGDHLRRNEALSLILNHTCQPFVSQLFVLSLYVVPLIFNLVAWISDRLLWFVD